MNRLSEVNEYWNWLIGHTYDNVHRIEDYSKLLHHLYSVLFCSWMPEDDARGHDGMDLRGDFCYNIYGEDALRLSAELGPCNILEMMVALAIRCEREIAYDPLNLPNYGRWFWIMIDSLGFNEQSNANYDPDYVQEVLCQFLMRKYMRDGRGSLFILNSKNVDARTLPIWVQMSIFINENPQLIG